MTKDLNFTAEIVKDGAYNKLRVIARSYFLSRIQTAPLGIVTLKVSYKKLKRSERQNALYWLYLGIISQQTGNKIHEDNDSEGLHELFKRKHLQPSYKKVLGEHITTYPSTTDLNKDEFSQYIKDIEVHTGILCPDTCIVNPCGKRTCDTCSKSIGDTQIDYPISTGEPKF